MSLRILSGKPIADAIKAEVAVEVAAIKANGGSIPCLVVIRVGEDPASAVYVGSKVRATEEVGLRSEHLHLDKDPTQDELVGVVKELNQRDDVDGILVQLPLPKQLNEREILEL